MASDKAETVAPIKKSYNVTFKYNRSTEIAISHKTIRFEPNETKIVDDNFITSPDFITRADDFVITEVK